MRKADAKVGMVIMATKTMNMVDAGDIGVIKLVEWPGTPKYAKIAWLEPTRTGGYTPWGLANAQWVSDEEA